MRDNITTTDLSEFGSRERKMAAELLEHWNNGNLPSDFHHDEVTIMMNKNSGSVFLTNSEYQAAMMNGDTLELWHFTPYEGHEGFILDLMQEHEPDDLNKDDLEYIKQAFENQDIVNESEIPESWRKLIAGE